MFLLFASSRWRRWRIRLFLYFEVFGRTHARCALGRIRSSSSLIGSCSGSIDSKTDPVVYDFALHKDRISKDPEYEKNVAATFLERDEKGIASLEHSAVEPEELLETFYRLQVYSEAEQELLGNTFF